MSDAPRQPGGMEHMPLPYTVRVRVIADEDAVPERREFHLVAYSVIKAVLQATLKAGGSSVNDSKVTVEEVRPDLLAYARMFNTPALIGVDFGSEVRP